MIAAAVSALVLSASPQLEAAASAGAGYDSNLNHADPTVTAIGSGFAVLRASGGASMGLGDSTNLYAGLRFDDEEYPEYSDLTTRTVGVELSLVQELGDQVAVVLTPWASQGWSGDPARDATTVAAQVTLRWRPVRDLALRGSYAYTSRAAADPVFSSDRNRLGASVEWRVLPRTYLSLAGALEQGDEVFYRSTGGAGGSGMGRMGGGGGGFGDAQEPYSAPATTLSAGPALEIGLGSSVYLVGSFEARRVQSDAADLRSQSVYVALGARL